MPQKWLNYPEFLSGLNKATTYARNLFHSNGCNSANYGGKKVRCTQHKLLPFLKFIVIVDFLFLEHFFYAKNKDTLACFWLFSWKLRTGISSFATGNIIEFLPNWVFLLLHGMLKFQVITNGDNHCIVEVLLLDLRSWHNWKVIVSVRTIFTTAGAKG